MAPVDRLRPVRVGVVGPPELVERMTEVANGMVGDFPAISLVVVGYQQQSQLPARVRGIADDVDAFVFAGPLPYDIAREAGALSKPATFVELAGSALYGTMLRAIRGGEIDVERVSIDSLAREAIAEAYDECGLGLSGVQSLSYRGVEDASQFADFHRQHFAAGRTTGALTTVGAVERELVEGQVPVLRIHTTRAALRASLRTAALLGTGHLLEAAHVVIGLVSLPELPHRTPGPGRVWSRQEMLLATVRALQPEMDRLGISVLPRDDQTIALVGTLSPVAELTRSFTAAPLLAELRLATGVTPFIGMGIGSSATAAETNAMEALTAARASGGGRVHLRFDDGTTLALSPDEDASPESEPRGGRHLDAYRVLQGALGERQAAGSAQLVDAESASELLGVSPRTARRILQDLARAGLAWPVPPPAAAAAPGRPRQTYRLVQGS